MPDPREIGPFDLLEKIGAGGMGEVFKARDRRLNRFVALKFLPDSANAAARERFQREALAIAALNHPNICALYEIGEAQGRPYLVLELLEGETLFSRLQRGPASVVELAQWSAEVADALQAAHAKGILHRDLKPSNIFITARGAAKVLDFGLAQIEASPPGSAAEAATLQAGPLTTPGTTLGTLAYMSPEQARGESTDARSDVFSLGVVAYEMASGAPPFRGRTALDVSAAILRETPPPPSSARPGLPPMLDGIVARCLEKDPELRYQSAADVRIEMKRLQRESGSQAAIASSVIAPPSSPVTPVAPLPSDSQIATGLLRRHWRWPAIGLAAVALAGLAWWYFAPGTAAPVHIQFRQLTFNGNVVDAAISPDGKFLAHVDNGPQGTSLHLLSIGSGSDVQIMPPAPGCCQSPSFSPDGNSVYFLENLVIKAVPVLGGAVRTIAPHACSGAGFSPDGSQVAFIDESGPSRLDLIVAQADGGAAHILNRAPAGNGYLSGCWISNPAAPFHPPAWSPDGRSIVVSSGPAGGVGYTMVIDAHSGAASRLGPGLVPTAADMNWLPDGRGLVFTAAIPDSAAPQVWELSYPGGKLTQLSFDLQGYTASSLAANGQLVALHSQPQSSIWVQAKPGGEFQQLPGGGNNQDGAAGLSWTAQNGLAIIRRLGGKVQFWEENADGSGAHMLAVDNMPEGPYDLGAAPNGQLIFGDSADSAAIWRVNADGSDLTELVHPAAAASAFTPSLIRGGTAVSFMMIDADGGQYLYTVPLAGGEPQKAWPGYIYAGTNPASPDGTRVFVMARGAGTGHTHLGEVIRVDGGQPQAAVVAGFDRATMRGPWRWTPDGRAIAYRQGEGTVNNIWATPVAGGAPFAISHFTDLQIFSYAASPDGRWAVSRGSPNSDAVVATGLPGKN